MSDVVVGNRKLTMVLTRDKTALFVCRGAPRCARDVALQSRIGPCPDCLATRDDETLGELAARLDRGDG